MCHPVLQILTLFQTKKCNFQYPFSDLSFQAEIMSSFLTSQRKQKKFFKLICLELKRTFIHSRRYLENHTRFQTKMGKCISVFRAKWRANPTRWGGTQLYSLHKGVPPSPPTPSLSVSPQFIETDSFIERFVKLQNQPLTRISISRTNH